MFSNALRRGLAAALLVAAVAGTAARAGDGAVHVSARFEGQPLVEVLETLGEHRALEVSGRRAVLATPVTHGFDGVPWREALDAVLAPFDHALVDGGPGTGPARVVVLGVKNRAAGRVAATEPAPPLAAPGAIGAAPGATVSERERALFGAPDPDPDLPPEIAAAFDPVQPPGTEITGPLPPADQPPGPVSMPDTDPLQVDPPGTGVRTDATPVIGHVPVTNRTGPVPEPADD